MEQVKPMVGDTVAIFGPGAIGLFHLQAFKAAGAGQVMMIGIDQDAKRFEVAKGLGADHIINSSKEDVVKRVNSAKDPLKEGIRICAETIKELKKFADGVHIMAIGMEEYIPQILEEVK